MDKHFFLKRLSINRPLVFTQYNYEFLPNNFKATDTIEIECYKHGLFRQKAAAHLFSSGCPTCAIEKNGLSSRLTTKAFIEKANAKFSNRFDYSKTVYIKKGTELSIICPIHGIFSIRPEAHMWSKHGCPRCDVEIPKIVRIKKLLDKAKKTHGGKYDYSKLDYGKFNSSVEIICPTHGSFLQRFYDHAHYGKGCPKCSSDSDRLTQEQFIDKARLMHGERYDYNKSLYKKSSDTVIITCKKHGDFRQRAGSHLNGCGCIVCGKEVNKLSSEEFIRNARNVHGDKYDYSKVKYNGNKRPVEIICPTHGSFWKKPNSHVSSESGCQLCCESRGERYLELCLKKYNIKHTREYKILPYRYRYDFFLPEFNIFIEYNGIQHYTPVEAFGGEEAYVRVKTNDKLKKDLVKQINGKLITITYKFNTIQSIEKELIRLLKIVYPYWIIVSGEIRVFKSYFDILNFFSIPNSVHKKDIIAEIEKENPSVKVLF